MQSLDSVWMPLTLKPVGEIQTKFRELKAFAQEQTHFFWVNLEYLNGINLIFQKRSKSQNQINFPDSSENSE